MADYETTVAVTDYLDKLVSAGKANWEPHDDGKTYLRLDTGSLFEIMGDGLKRIE